MEGNVITVSMAWESNLSVNDRYTRGTRPKLRPEVQAWQEELAWEIKSSLQHCPVDLGPQLVVDVAFFFPEDGRTRDADNYFKTILDAVQMGTGIDDSNFVPFVRGWHYVHPNQSGFMIRVYSASFAGHGLTGELELLNGKSIIILDRLLPTDWRGTRVAVNLGVIHGHD